MIATTTKATFLILTMFCETLLVKAWQLLMYSLLMLTSCQVFKCANSSSVSQQNAKYLKPRRNSFSLSQFLKRKKNQDVQIIKLNWSIRQREMKQDHSMMRLVQLFQKRILKVENCGNLIYFWNSQMTVTQNGRCWNDRLLQTCKVCHLPEAHTQWLDESRYPMKQQELISFNATWDKSWEPFYISSRNVPLFDERFKQYGFDRIEQICELHIAGYKFPVLNNAFLVHDVSTWILLKSLLRKKKRLADGWTRV